MELQTIERSAEAELWLMIEAECADAVLGVAATVYEPVSQPELMLGYTAINYSVFRGRIRVRNIANTSATGAGASR
jgi:hypothetical protein